MELSGGATLLGSFPIQARSGRGILRNASSRLQQQREEELSVAVVLVRREAKPLGCFGIVLWDALAFEIHAAKIELSVGVALVGRQTKPLGCFGVVLRDTVTCVINLPESDLRVVEALI